MANAKDELLGKQVRCGRCKEPFTVQKAGAAEEEAWQWNRRRMMERTVAISLALVFHLAVFGIVALLALRTPEAVGEGPLFGIGELPAERLTENDEGSLAPDAAAGDSAPADEFTLPINVAVTSPDAIPIDVQMVPSGGTTSGEGGFGMDAFAPGGKGGGVGGGANFMGAGASGSRFCIIADRSFSMAGARLEYAKSEVLKTISDLRGGARFFVIFFDDIAHPMPSDRWLSSREVSLVADWVSKVSPGGGTEPVPGFRAAFNLNPKPDVIFFMTDGEFDPTAPAEIARMNAATGKKVIIHTICFGDRSGERQMRLIADQSGGKYRYVADVGR
jgi:hypothetical protein